MKNKIIKLLDDWKVNKHKQELIADELLVLCGVTQQRELLLDYTNQLKKQGTLTKGQNEKKLVEKYLSNNSG